MTPIWWLHNTKVYTQVSTCMGKIAKYSCHSQRKPTPSLKRKCTDLKATCVEHGQRSRCCTASSKKCMAGENSWLNSKEPVQTLISARTICPHPAPPPVPRSWMNQWICLSAPSLLHPFCFPYYPPPL
jgi:hypothetical protein